MFFDDTLLAIQQLGEAVITLDCSLSMSTRAAKRRSCGITKSFKVAHQGTNSCMRAIQKEFSANR